MNIKFIAETLTGMSEQKCSENEEWENTNFQYFWRTFEWKNRNKIEQRKLFGKKTQNYIDKINAFEFLFHIERFILFSAFKHQLTILYLLCQIRTKHFQTMNGISGRSNEVVQSTNILFAFNLLLNIPGYEHKFFF